MLHRNKLENSRVEFKSHRISYSLMFIPVHDGSGGVVEMNGTQENLYVHFGDFDLAGINIFLTEFHRYLGSRSSFLIPADIESRIVKGSVERYDAQYARFHNLSTDIPELQTLIGLINRHHRCYDQEGYILG
ncbi:MAG: hypothetical protein NC335_06510 [Bacteroides sp.]|nr:hypothetical protein [Bacteroides sp.]